MGWGKRLKKKFRKLVKKPLFAVGLGVVAGAILAPVAGPFLSKIGGKIGGGAKKVFHAILPSKPKPAAAPAIEEQKPIMRKLLAEAGRLEKRFTDKGGGDAPAEDPSGAEQPQVQENRPAAPAPAFSLFGLSGATLAVVGIGAAALIFLLLRK